MSGPRYHLVPPKRGWPEPQPEPEADPPRPEPEPPPRPYNMADEQATFYGWRERERTLLRSELTGETPAERTALARRANLRWHCSMLGMAIGCLAFGLWHGLAFLLLVWVVQTIKRRNPL